MLFSAFSLLILIYNELKCNKSWLSIEDKHSPLIDLKMPLCSWPFISKTLLIQILSSYAWLDSGACGQIYTVNRSITKIMHNWNHLEKFGPWGTIICQAIFLKKFMQVLEPSCLLSKMVLNVLFCLYLMLFADCLWRMWQSQWKGGMYVFNSLQNMCIILTC